jgi:hypothetical protein
MPPFGHFSLIRFGKSAGSAATKEDRLEAHVIG